MSELENPSFGQKILKFFGTILKAIGALAIAIVLIVILLAWPLISNRTPPQYANINEHFKYASIGGESTNGIPYWVWKVLPIVFPEKLPGEGYKSLGFIQESDRDLPIGFAKGINPVLGMGLDVVVQNCATCHAGTLRDRPDSPPQIITTMPSNTVDLGGYIQFLRNVAEDPRFNAYEMMPYIESIADLNIVEKLLYRFLIIPQTRDALTFLSDRLSFIDRQTEYGPGRVDTFTPYKARQFNFPIENLGVNEFNGIADFPSIWAQRPREGMQLHWDGNNTSVNERNNSAALALVAPTNINFDAIYRVADWLLDLPSPPYPYAIDRDLAAKGKPIFQQNCASCHAFDGDYIGTVIPIEEIGTDAGRLDSYTYELASNQYTLFTGISYRDKDQRFTHFRKTNGYANMPLDGIWLRSPYLHNGSVPTLRDLLEVPENRPAIFYRGYDVLDRENVGFVSNISAEGKKKYFPFDTSLPGNANSGHLYGTDLEPEAKDALIEYLKTL